MDFRTASVVDLAAQVRSGVADGGRTGGPRAGSDRRRTTRRSTPSSPSTRPGPGPPPTRSTPWWPPGGDPGPLAGIPIGVKDLEDAAGYVTTHGSAAYADGSAGHRRLDPGGPTGGGRVRGGGQDQHARTRLEGRHRQPAVRAHPQPVEPRPHAGRLVGRERRGHRLGHGAARHRLGRRWLAADPVVVLRAVGHEAVARPGAVGWRRGPGLAAPVDQGPDGPADGRPGGRPRRGGRAGSDRPAVAAPARGVVAGRARRAPTAARVAWSPTLGYAEIDDEVLDAVPSGPSTCWPTSATEVVEVDTVFDEDPIDQWLTLSGVYNLRTHAGDHRTPSLGAGRPGAADGHRGGGRHRRRSTWSGPRTPATPSTSGWSTSSTTCACW